MEFRTAIPEYSGVYHLQEYDHHLDRVWRSRLVWWKCHGAESRLVRSHGQYELRRLEGGTDASHRSSRRSLLRRLTSRELWGQLLQRLLPTRASDTSG